MNKEINLAQYKILLFDVDDTLLDFGENESESLKKLFEIKGVPLTDEVLCVYHKINDGLWNKYERGQVAMDDMLKARFALTMFEFGIIVDGAEWERQYQSLLGEGVHFVDDALEVCQRLSQSYRMFVVTNAVRETQFKRLKAAKLYDLFEDIFDSQSMGYQKPLKEFFDEVIRRISGFDARDALIIGDSLNTDIKGGLAAGIDTCWLNRHHKDCDPQIKSTYTISKLTELYDILGMTHEG